MKITSSYGVELRKQNIPIRQTLDVYRSAVSYLVEIYAQVWEELEELEGILEAKKRFNEAEHLIHPFSKDAFLSEKGSHPACAGKRILLQNSTGIVEKNRSERK